ncbi:hypothetical protein HPB47_014643, partial [Ixodes persulcatus]
RTPLKTLGRRNAVAVRLGLGRIGDIFSDGWFTLPASEHDCLWFRNSWRSNRYQSSQKRVLFKKPTTSTSKSPATADENGNINRATRTPLKTLGRRNAVAVRLGLGRIGDIFSDGWFTLPASEHDCLWFRNSWRSNRYQSSQTPLATCGSPFCHVVALGSYLARWRLRLHSAAVGAVSVSEEPTAEERGLPRTPLKTLGRRNAVAVRLGLGRIGDIFSDGWFTLPASEHDCLWFRNSWRSNRYQSSQLGLMSLWKC